MNESKIEDIAIARDARDQKWDVTRLLEILLQEIRSGKCKPEKCIVIYETQDGGVEFRVGASTSMDIVESARLFAQAKVVFLDVFEDSIRKYIKNPHRFDPEALIDDIMAICGRLQ